MNKRKIFGISAILILLLAAIPAVNAASVRTKPLVNMVSSEKSIETESRQNPTTLGGGKTDCKASFHFSYWPFCIGFKFKYWINEDDINMLCDAYYSDDFETIKGYVEDLMGKFLPDIAIDVIDLVADWLYWYDGIDKICGISKGDGVYFEVICPIVGIPALPYLLEDSIRPQ